MDREAFEKWWDSGDDISNSGPWEHDTPIQFAWDGWQAAKADSAAQVRPASVVGVVVNNNQHGNFVTVQTAPHTTIPVGAVLIPCLHPDVVHDGCVVCGKSIVPNRPQFDWLTATEPKP